MKYSGEPMKFLDNEVDLLSIIRGLAQVCAELNCVQVAANEIIQGLVQVWEGDSSVLVNHLWWRITGGSNH
jgi:hypothetical protein